MDSITWGILWVLLVCTAVIGIALCVAISVWVCVLLFYAGQMMGVMLYQYVRRVCVRVMGERWWDKR
ncbi:hypothetical protein SEA_YAKULT_72 [Gordonia phage Yakult]|nr:hypothetical protein SEA_YAKULT_72 [Gordonia phage Yakult]